METYEVVRVIPRHVFITYGSKAPKGWFGGHLHKQDGTQRSLGLTIAVRRYLGVHFQHSKQIFLSVNHNSIKTRTILVFWFFELTHCLLFLRTFRAKEIVYEDLFGFHLLLSGRMEDETSDRRLSDSLPLIWECYWMFTITILYFLFPSSRFTNLFCF